MGTATWIFIGLGAFLVLVFIYDVTQKKHAILRNFPIIGHFRYILETVGPELRQYIVTSNNEELPFNRDERTWVYASAKLQNNYFGFGTDNDLESAPNSLIIKQSAFPLSLPSEEMKKPIPCAKVLGEHRGRKHAFRPQSILSVSAMSFGSLSANAVKALNMGCAQAQCLHNTGEGGISDHHRQGGELIYQIGTGYYGARAEDGTFSLPKFLDTVASANVRAIEVKISQGAKPGKGGVLPGEKVTAEIARVRGIPVGESCLSPSSHSAFHDVDSLLDFVEELADKTGLPVGIKSAVGDIRFFEDLADQMRTTSRGVDYLQIDGGEGGTGAAPLVFSDHVSLPFKLGFTRAYRAFAERGMEDKLVWFGSGKLGFPHAALLSFALGCDMVAMAREPMLAIGCIQAQRCQTGHCPTGVATQNSWLARGLDPESKAVRFANYAKALRKELRELSHACGVPHPAFITPDHFEIINESFGSRTATEVFNYEPHWGSPTEAQFDALLQEMSLKTNFPMPKTVKSKVA